MIFNNRLFDENNYAEIKALDELTRELQNETLNEDWGYWHFSLLNLEQEDDLEKSLHRALYAIPIYREHTDLTPGTKDYISILDLRKLKLEPVSDLKQEVISKAEHWSTYQGPTSNPKAGISEKFHDLKHSLAEKLVEFLKAKEIVEVKLTEGLDTCYSFGGDHCGDDILIKTKAGVYVIHFGFST